MPDITQYIMEHEANIRLTAFVSIFVLMAIIEMIFPCRPLIIPKLKRWFNNITLVILNSVIVRLIFPAAAVGMAVSSEKLGFGLFHYVDLPYVLEVLLCAVLLDFAIYLQHVAVHYVPMFWRFHRVHHVDLDFDVTTGARFHPVEIVFSMCVKFVVIMLLGAPVLAVLIFETLLSSSAMFNHSNINLPARLDKLLRWFIVTPNMHRIHHSVIMEETNSNFGFNLPWWDRIFKTYRIMPQEGHIGMEIGVHGFRQESECVNLPGILKLPFRQE